MAAVSAGPEANNAEPAPGGQEAVNAPFLEDRFDAVVMLTWSDWHTEPRSNRYNYATRFARYLPVFFVQPDGAVGDEISSEKIDGHDIEIVHVAPVYDGNQTEALKTFLRARGVQRPLLWVYNVFFIDFIAKVSSSFRIFHATDDYVSPTERLAAVVTSIAEEVRSVLRVVDMVVAVSEGLERGYRQHGQFVGPLLVLKNGCDFVFWHGTNAHHFREAANAAPAVLFQGTINTRLDYELIRALVDRMPDWEFRLAGDNKWAPPAWQEIRNRPNVRAYGRLSVEEVATLAQSSRVGIAPYLQDGLIRRSLPLKAYEYLACGLPVVSVPIDELAARGDLFSIATTAEEFAAAITVAAASRDDPEQIERRLVAARAASYDARFAELAAEIVKVLHRRAKLRPKLNVLIVYDDWSNRVRTVVEHLELFDVYSRHRMTFVPGTSTLPGIDDADQDLDLDMFDAVIIHYCVRLSLENHISPGMARAIAAYSGPKLLFIQDEYDTTETARKWMERLGIDAVFTNVPMDMLDRVYPRTRFPNVDFIPTLTGYVPEDPALDDCALPLENRKTLIGYRGRKLSHQYGALGYDKYRIGRDVKRAAEERGLPVDIEVDDSLRIYGLDWYKFLGSCVATLGTESGSNVFDFTGDLVRLAHEHTTMDFETFSALYLRPHEGQIEMNQISPKIFEAIRLRTVLILFEGKYSHIVEPQKHYIPLKKDLSNIDEVIAKIQNREYVRNLTERAYRDIIASGRYTYRSFIASIDEYLDRRARGRRRATIVSPPMAALYAGAVPGPMQPSRTSAAIFNSAILGRFLTRERMGEVMNSVQFAIQAPVESAIQAPVESAIEAPVESAIQAPVESAIQRPVEIVPVPSPTLPAATWPVWKKGARVLWHVLPRRLRYTIAGMKSCRSRNAG